MQNSNRPNMNDERNMTLTRMFNKRMTLFDDMFNDKMNKTFSNLNLIEQPSLTNILTDKYNEGFIVKDNTYIYEMNFPKNLIDVTKIIEKNGTIIIKAKKQIINDESKNSNPYKSTSLMSIYKSINIPLNAIKNTAFATYKHGKLIITIQKQSI